eukprot:TRINITY_DN21339_c0_g1_i2.p1 TRINITY_DN21339_c0_g1~~TRINITY_DN21339_c0_g1_i2.p1  ORF type:complete len:1397 (+),score=432.70 TRINITY_DN21339_c0_g1_i2:191-4192(+)
MQREDWSGGKGGSIDMALNAATDPEIFFNEEQQDPDPWDIPRLAQHNVGWKRPYQIFSPFKPVVVRPTVPYDPYPDDDITLYSDGKLEPADEDDQPITLSRDDAVARYRVVRQLRSADPCPSSGDRRGRHTGGASSPMRPGNGSPPRRRKDGRQQATPCYMQAFNSVLMAVAQMQRYVPKGQFLWELIYPKEREGSLWPKYNPCGRYTVRLWFRGCHRKVVIDDRLPTDIFGQSLLAVTEGKEVWPALLAKAMLKVLSRNGSSRLFEDPVWMLTTLMAGYVPAHRSPTPNSSEVLQAMELMSKQRPGVNDVWRREGEPAPVAEEKAAEKVVIVATIGCSAPVPRDDCVELQPIDGESSQQLRDEAAAKRAQLKELGLHQDQLYHVVEARPLQDTTMLRLASPFISWRGEGSYDSRDMWTPDFEAELGFKREDRMRSDNQWNDCWMLWETFADLFQSVSLLYCSASRKFQHAVAVRDEDMPQRAVGGVGGQPTALRWLRFKADHPTRVLCCFQAPVGEQPAASAVTPRAGTAAAKPAEKKRGSVKQTAPLPVPEPELDPDVPPPTPAAGFRCVLRSFSWADPVPLRRLRQFECDPHSTDCFAFTVPHGDRAYQIELTGLPRGSVFAVLSARADGVEVRESRDELCSSCFGVGTWRDEGETEEHLPLEANVWFKRMLTVKAQTLATFQLTALPPSAGAAPAAEETKAAKPAKGAKKEAPAHPQLEPLDEETVCRIRAELAEKRIDLASWARLSLLNTDTGERWYGTGGYLCTTLEPRKDGREAQYILSGHAVAGEGYPRAAYRLTASADTATFDKGVPVGCKDLVRREGSYVVDKRGRVFRYLLTPQEALSASIVLRLESQKEVPFTFRIYKNDDLLWECCGTSDSHTSGPPGGPLVSSSGPVVLEHISMTAPEKGATLKYAAECTLGTPSEPGGTIDQSYAKALALEVRRRTVAQFHERAKGQSQNSTADGDADDVPSAESTSVAALCPEWDVKYYLKFLCSSSKMAIEDDATEKERLNEVKAEWSREETAAAGGKADAKAGRGKAAAGPPPTQEDTRTIRANRVRRGYLRNTGAALLPPQGQAADAQGSPEVPADVVVADAEVVEAEGGAKLADAQRWLRAAATVLSVSEEGTVSVMTDSGEQLDGLRPDELELIACWQHLEQLEPTPPPAAAQPPPGKRPKDPTPPPQDSAPPPPPKRPAAPPPDREHLEPKDYVVITERRKVCTGDGCTLTLIDSSGRKAAVVAEEEKAVQWRKGFDDEMESQRVTEEQRVKYQGDEQVEMHHHLQLLRMDMVTDHRRMREEYFNVLRSRGDLPKDPEPEPDDAKKKAKKK